MLHIPSAKLTPHSPKLTIEISSPLQQPPQCPRTPAFSRKGGQSRRDKAAESLKSSGERSVQKSLRYTKILPREWKNEDSEVHSEVHIIHMLTGRLEDSQETIAHRGRSHSHNKQAFLYPKNASPKPKSPGRKVFEDFTAGNETSMKSKINHKSDQHYIYWKNKAYEYLESNIKLMEEVRRLARENGDLKSTIAELQQELKGKARTDESRIYSEKALSTELRNISSIYISKIEGMEKELKRKEIIIATYELKVGELNARLAGDGERIKLMNKLQEDVEAMKAEGWDAKVDHLKLESNYYASTSILISENSNR